MRRSETPGVSATISAAWSALYFDVMKTLAWQSLRMYASSPLVSRDEHAV
jgi:hypothetical protein